MELEVFLPVIVKTIQNELSVIKLKISQCKVQIHCNESYRGRHCWWPSHGFSLTPGYSTSGQLSINTLEKATKDHISVWDPAIHVGGCFVTASADAAILGVNLWKEDLSLCFFSISVTPGLKLTKVKAELNRGR